MREKSSNFGIIFAMSVFVVVAFLRHSWICVVAMHFVWIFVCKHHVLCNKSALIKNKNKKGFVFVYFSPRNRSKMTIFNPRSRTFDRRSKRIVLHSNGTGIISPTSLLAWFLRLTPCRLPRTRAFLPVTFHRELPYMEKVTLCFEKIYITVVTPV